MNEADRFAGRFLIPGGLWLLAFFAVPFVIVIALSFGTPGDLGGAVYGWYPENYSRAFDPLFVPVLAALGRLRAGDGRAVPRCSATPSRTTSRASAGATSTC